MTTCKPIQWLALMPDRIKRVECLQVADDYVLRRRAGVSFKVRSPRERATYRYCDTWEEAKAFLLNNVQQRLDKLRDEELKLAYQCKVIHAIPKPEHIND